VPITKDATQQMISNMLNGEEVFGESNSAIVKVMLMVEYDGHQIFKATLVSQFNAKVPKSDEVAFKKGVAMPTFDS
jgi:hypothetical protein